MAGKTTEKQRIWEYLLVIWWLLTVSFAAFGLVYGARYMGFMGGVGTGIVVLAFMFIIRTMINIQTGGQFREKHYLQD